MSEGEVAFRPSECFCFLDKFKILSDRRIDSDVLLEGREVEECPFLLEGREVVADGFPDPGTCRSTSF